MSEAPFPSPTKKWHDTAYPAISPSRPELSAKGKIVVVTGGGTGIGAETARCFAEAGASRIALLGRRKQPLLDTKAAIEKAYPSVDVFVASTDVTKKTEVDAAFAGFLGNGAKIDVLISNAAMSGPIEGIGDEGFNGEAFLSGIQQNVSGQYHVADAFLRHAAPNAVAVEVNSGAGFMNFTPKFHSYGVAKLAVYRLWDCIAFKYPELSIFHTQPGVVDTEMNRAAGGVAAMGFEDHVSLPGSFHCWLASPEARFLRNKFVFVNWDVDELKARAKEIESGTELGFGLVGWPWSGGGWASQWKD